MLKLSSEFLCSVRISFSCIKSTNPKVSRKSFVLSGRVSRAFSRIKSANHNLYWKYQAKFFVSVRISFSCTLRSNLYWKYRAISLFFCQNRTFLAHQINKSQFILKVSSEVLSCQNKFLVHEINISQYILKGSSD